MVKRVFVQLWVVLVFSLASCGDDASSDAGASDVGADGSAVECTPVTCEIACPFGFARGTDGCEICACAEERVNTCLTARDCAIATDATSCCECPTAYAGAVVDREPCLVESGRSAPPGCAPDPEMCALVDCIPCEPAVGLMCSSDMCVGVP